VTGTSIVLRPARTSRSLRLLVGVEAAFVALVTAGIALLLARQFRAPGSEMDEGAVLAYSDRIVHGAVPWRDFQTFYGPGNLWLVGLVSKVFGPSVTTERMVGLCYRLAVVLGLYVIARCFGRAAGLLALGLCAFLVPGQGVAALALWGSVAFAVCALAALAAAAGRSPDRVRSGLLVAAGASSGLAVLVRFDLVLAVALAAAVLLPLVSWRERGRFLLAFAVVAAAYVPQVWLTGRGDLARLVEQLRHTEPGRRLPFPTPQTFPGMIFVPGIVVTVLLVIVGALLVRRRRQELRPRVMLASGLFSLALLPTALSRMDGVHIVPFAVVPIALLPALVITLAQPLRGDRRQAIVAFAGTVAALALCAGSVLVVLGAGPPGLREVVTPQALVSFRVTSGGRWFPLADRSEAEASQAMVAAAARLARPGQALFVGPADLRFTNYNDTYLYYLLPQLRPASFYMEMNPQTANLPGSDLPAQLRHADWLILSRRYARWSEQNSSSKRGSALPNRIVASDFCTVAASGDYRLLRRCR